MQNQDVIFRQFFQPDLKLDWMLHSYIQLGAVTKVNNHSGYFVIGDFDFFDNFTGDRAIGPPATNRFMSCHGELPCSMEQYAKEHTCNHPGMARGKSKTTPLNVKFGKRLAALREERGWTYTYMSEHSGVATTFLHNLEHGTKEPCLNTLDVLAKSFDMSMSELLKGI